MDNYISLSTYSTKILNHNQKIFNLCAKYWEYDQIRY